MLNRRWELHAGTPTKHTCSDVSMMTPPVLAAVGLQKAVGISIPRLLARSAVAAVSRCWVGRTGLDGQQAAYQLGFLLLRRRAHAAKPGGKSCTKT